MPTRISLYAAVMIPVFLLITAVCAEKAQSFCNTPSKVFESQYKTESIKHISGLVQDRYLLFLSDGRYIQLADTYSQTVNGEVVLPGTPVEGAVDSDDQVFVALKERKIVSLSAVSPEPSLWEVTKEADIGGLPTAITVTNDTLAVAFSSTEGAMAAFFDKKSLENKFDPITVKSTGMISDIMIQNNKAYILLEALGQVVVYDVTTGEKISEASAGSGPTTITADQERNQLLITNPGADSITVLNMETLAIKKTIQSINLLTGPTSVVISGTKGYAAGSGAKAVLASISLEDLEIMGDAVSLSEDPMDLFFLDKDDIFYLAMDSGLYYVFPDSCLKVKTRRGQEAWKGAYEILTSPDETFGMRVEGGRPPFDLSLGGGITCETDQNDADDRTFTCTAGLSGNVPLLISDGSGNSRTVMVRTASLLTIDPSADMRVTAGSEPLIFTADGGFDTISWWTMYGMLSGNQGRTIVYFPPTIANADTLTAMDRSGNTAEVNITVDVPYIAVTPAQAVLLTGNTYHFTAIGPDGADWQWQATAGVVTQDGGETSYTAPDAPMDVQVAAIDMTTGKSGTARVFVVAEEMTISPSETTIDREEGVVFRVTGSKGPYTWTATAGDMDTNQAESIVYTAPDIAGDYEVRVMDIAGRTATAYVRVGKTMRISPAVSVVRPDETVKLSITGAEGQTGWQAEEGGFIEKSNDSAVYQAPMRTGRFDVAASDDRGRVAVARVIVSGDNMSVSPQNVQVDAGETQIFAVLGGIGPYVWQFTSGIMATPDGSSIIWVAPSDPPEEKVIVTVEDSMGAAAAAEIEILTGDGPGYGAIFKEIPETVYPGGSMKAVIGLYGSGFAFYAAILTPDGALYMITDQSVFQLFNGTLPAWKETPHGDTVLFNITTPEGLPEQKGGLWNLYTLQAPLELMDPLTDFSAWVLNQQTFTVILE